MNKTYDPGDPIYDPRHREPSTWEDRILQREIESEEIAYRLAEEYWAEQERLEPWERPDFGPRYRDGYTPDSTAGHVGRPRR